MFDAGFNDWLAFLCGTGQLTASYCPSIAIDPSNLNYPSIAIGALAGSQTVMRTVTNVGSASETYTFSSTGLAGITVGLPGAFTIAPGATKSFSITFTASGAALNAYVEGAIVLTGSNGHVVRSPVVLRPVALAAPAQVSGTYNVTFGYNGPFTADARGLVPAAKATGSIATGGVVNFPVAIPAGTTYARFSLFDSEIDQASDLDLEVYNSGGTLVGSSGGGTTAEEVNLLNPAPGTYTVRVLGFAVPVGTANFTMFSWALGSTAAGNMIVTAPPVATLGTTGSINISTSGLSPATKYLGSVVYGGAPGLPNPTIVRIDTP